MDTETLLSTSSDIAIIGMSCRVPGANNIEQFWTNLKRGIESVEARAQSESLALFDAQFFKFTPRQAQITDPQVRLFLEAAWEVFEDAGYEPTSSVHPIGVYAGMGTNAYLSKVLANRKLVKTVGRVGIDLANERSSLSCTTSYKLNLRGPSLTVQTACSTSLVATHLACQALLEGECDLALAGAASLSIPDGEEYAHEGGILSPDGHCRAFDIEANGAVGGDGVCVVLLKRLQDAVADGDHIRAVIKGSAVNNDGLLKVGYSAPSTEGQATVIRAAQTVAQINAESISYVEAHGTGTPLGDPIEVAALTEAFRSGTDKKQFCAIGSVKTNIGHLDAAAGLAGLIKVALALENKQIPASLNYQTANPDIDFSNSPFFVNSRLRDWVEPRPLRAGVSSFGMGGTNAHLILEEAPERSSSGPSRPVHLLVLSSETEVGLENSCRNLATYLKQTPSLSMADVAYTLQVGRKHFRNRRAVVCRTAEDAVISLETSCPQSALSEQTTESGGETVFLFSGEGPNTTDLCKELYNLDRTFREVVDRCCRYIKDTHLVDFQDVFRSTDGATDDGSINPSSMGEPAWFVLEYALAKVWISWGIKPGAVIGHGTGDYVAACIAGVLTEQEACALIVARSRLVFDLLDHEARKTDFKPPQIPYLSCATGSWIEVQDFVDPTYWVRRTCEAGGVEAAIGRIPAKFNKSTFLEVGPTDVLSLIRQKFNPEDRTVIRSIRTNAGINEALLSLVDALGSLWLAGVKPSWQDYYSGETRHRVSLPRYEFERQRYWADDLPNDDSADMAATVIPFAHADTGEWFYTPSWKQSYLSACHIEAEPDSHWLIFTDDDGLGDDLVHLGIGIGQDFVRVRRGQKFARIDRDYTVRPGQPEDYVTLLAELRKRNEIPRRIVHFWGAAGEDSAEAEATDYSLFYSVLFLAQAVGRELTGSHVEIDIVSSHVHVVTGHETVVLGKSTVLGLCLSIPQEYQGISCRNIDVEPSKTGTWQRLELCRNLLRDLLLGASGEVIAYRGPGHRWTRTYEHLRINGGKQNPARRLRQGGTYLITGGLGSIGLTVAEFLARSVHAQIVLVGRSPFPAESEWDKWLSAHVPEDDTSKTIKILQGFRKLGSRILIGRADVSKAADMLAVVLRTHEEFGDIHGVVHAAGHAEMSDSTWIRSLDVRTCRKFFEAKIDGLRVLEEVLADEPLEFGLLFSSLSSVLGGLGYSAYSAANTFMDTFCQDRQRRRPLVWTSLNWDGWNIKNPEVNGDATSNESRGIQRHEGIKALNDILNLESGFAQLIVSKQDLGIRIRNWITQDTAEPVDTDRYLSPDRSAPEGTEVARPTDRVVAGMFEEVLGVKSVKASDDFYELGGDSLAAVQLLSHISGSFGPVVSLEYLFGNLTPEKLARQIDAVRSLEKAVGQVEKRSIRLERRSRSESLPLSFAQRRLWFLNRLKGPSATYNLPLRLRLRGALDVKALEKALGDLIARHESLRTIFVGASETPQIRILGADAGTNVLRIRDTTESEVGAAIEEAAACGFDLAQDIPLNAWLFRIGEEHQVLLLLLHHIAGDFLSMEPLARDLAKAYAARSQGREPDWAPLPVQYLDYALWQQEVLGDGTDPNGAMSRQLAYWLDALAGLPEEIDLPRDRSRPSVASYRGEVVLFPVEAELHSKLLLLASESQASLFMVLQAGLAVLLMRMGAGTDIALGSPIAGRTDDALDDLIGFFVNTLVLRTDLSGNPSFRELLARVRQRDLAAYANQELPFERLIEMLNPPRSMARHPLFQVLLTLQKDVMSSFELPGLDVTPEPVNTHTSKFDLTFSIVEQRGAGGTPQGLVIYIEYATDLFDCSTVEGMGRRLVRLFEVVTYHSDQPIEQIDILTAQERHRVVYEWNATEAEFPRDKCIQELFEEQVEKTPEAIAVVFERDRLSYAELNRRANKLAHYLRELGVKPDVLVAVCVERGFGMIVSLLAVLKAGGAYVPLDPGYPEERLRYMLEDSAPAVLLTQRHLLNLFAGLAGVPVIDLTAVSPGWRDKPEANPDRASNGLTSRHLAYVIYTSGSTGHPKGVMVEHRGLVNYLHWAVKSYSPTDGAIVSSSISFDATVTSLYAPLLCGGATRLLPERDEVDGLSRQIRSDRGCGLLKVTPSHLDVLGRYLLSEGLRAKAGVFVIGGENLSNSTIHLWRQIQPDARLINEYGPTETVVGCVAYDIPGHLSSAKSIPIGQPIANTCIYILDRHGEPVPLGVTGELHIGGAGVARGYLNRPELTAERFVPNPFVADGTARMYKTGDLGRWLADRTIEFLGRNDVQIKIRGFRIEPGEIEARLVEHSAVGEALVVAREDATGDKRLVAYYSLTESERAGVRPEELHAHLASRLPEHMVPAAYVGLPRLPLTANGKLDRRALPVPAAEGYAMPGYEAPTSELEMALARIWAEVLDVDRVGRRDNFFELGGHSLLALLVISRVRQTLQLQVAVGDVFAWPVLADLATAVETQEVRL